MKTILENIRFMQKGTLCFGDLYMEDGFIQRIDYKTPKPHSDIAINGFIDIHTHGFRGVSTTSTDPLKLQELAMLYAKRGIVGFCATLPAMSLKRYEEILQAYRKAFQGDYKGARFLGIHLEGPFLNPLQTNDCELSDLQAIDLKELESFLFRNSDIIKVISIAPEVQHGQEAIRMLHRFGIKASIGHTKCSYEEALAAIENGATHVTHICNAMDELSHKHSSVMDAILNSDNLCEMNVDQIHIQKAMLQWLISVLGPDRIMCISDGSSFSGFEYPDGFRLDEHHVVKQNAIYYDDVLSGSFRDLFDAFQYLYKELEYTVEDCMKMTSINAGRELQSLNYEIGLGKKVDLVILDHNMELQDVIIQGKHAL